MGKETTVTYHTGHKYRMHSSKGIWHGIMHVCITWFSTWLHFCQAQGAEPLTVYRVQKAKILSRGEHKCIKPLTPVGRFKSLFWWEKTVAYLSNHPRMWMRGELHRKIVTYLPSPSFKRPNAPAVFFSLLALIWNDKQKTKANSALGRTWIFFEHIRT